jgi:predicted TIM-barrel fold metal-dependent hydrolase
MKIDSYAHIFPEKYLAALAKKAPGVKECLEARRIENINLEMRLRLMDRYPGVLQVLTISEPPLESFVNPREAAELARIANDELAELVVKYPDKFIAGVACLPMNDMEASLLEADRAITKLGLKGVQINSRIEGDTLDNPKFRPLFAKMAEYDLPIWIHPGENDKIETKLFGRAVESSIAMELLVKSGIFIDYPGLKIIIHHCGAMIPSFEGRIKYLMPNHVGATSPIKNPLEHFRKFYTDTATYGSTPALMCGYAFFGADHLLFGTDAPLGPKNGLTLGTIESVENMSISDVDKDKIFKQNAINLLKIAI